MHIVSGACLLSTIRCGTGRVPAAQDEMIRDDIMRKAAGVVIGIDASRNRSGGAKAHLIGILTEGDPLKHGICEVHVWTFKSLLDAIPDQPWLIKHHPKELEQSLPKQLWWQATKLSEEAAAASCDILFATDASTLCRFKPMVVLSQDMLSYEPGVMKCFGYTKARLRLLAILLVQNRAMRCADGVIFLTKYAAKTIQKSCGSLSHVAYVPHGVGEEFRRGRSIQNWPDAHGRPVRCLYVSNAEMYKHQWVVVQAVAALRNRGHNISLTLVGGGAGRAQQLLDEQIARLDPDGDFVEKMPFVPQQELPSLLVDADVFVFASSCENMPITLIEAMAAGLPIACSNRGPMPEVLADGGVYFDPEDADSIASAVQQIIGDPVLRQSIAQRAENLSSGYSWSRCADETWAFITETYRSIAV
jgi:glycosyltransferase involved in cell wall biosynthesis